MVTTRLILYILFQYCLLAGLIHSLAFIGTGLSSTSRLDSSGTSSTAKTVGHAAPVSTPETSISSEPSYNPEDDDIPETVGIQGGEETQEKLMADTCSKFNISGMLALQK